MTTEPESGATAFTHETREENLRAAKAAVRSKRGARMLRRADLRGDTIDIMVGREVIERHFCPAGTGPGLSTAAGSGRISLGQDPGAGPEMYLGGIAVRRRFCVEAQALYQ